MSARTHVAVDLASVTEAVERAGPADTIVTAFPPDAPRPLLGFAAASGRWHVASWSPANPCGAWSVRDGKAVCRVPVET